MNFSDNLFLRLVLSFKNALEHMPTDNYKVIIKADKRPRNEHQGRFNEPSEDDIAVVISGMEESQGRDIILHKRKEGIQRISETNKSYDALQYPILFWQGEDGYEFTTNQVTPGTQNPTDKKVSAQSFYAYRIMVRSNSESHLINCRALFSQFLVDMYAKIETERLLFIRCNQQKLRCEQYIHLQDAIANDEHFENIGKKVILPSSYTGSPRHMHQYAQDAMAYVGSY